MSGIKLTKNQIRGRKEAFNIVKKAKGDPKDLEKILNTYNITINISGPAQNLLTASCLVTSNIKMFKWLYENGVNDQNSIDNAFYNFVTHSKNKTMFNEVFDWFDEIGARLENVNMDYKCKSNEKIGIYLHNDYKGDKNYMKLLGLFIININEYNNYKLNKIGHYIDKYYDIKKKSGIKNMSFIHYFIISLDYRDPYICFDIHKYFNYIDSKNELCCFDNKVNFYDVDIDGNTYLHLYFMGNKKYYMDCRWHKLEVYVYDKKLLDIKNNDGYTPLMLFHKEMKNLNIRPKKTEMDKILCKLGYDINKDENNYFS